MVIFRKNVKSRESRDRFQTEAYYNTRVSQWGGRDGLRDKGPPRDTTTIYIYIHVPTLINSRVFLPVGFLTTVAARVHACKIYTLAQGVGIRITRGEWKANRNYTQ